MNEAYRPPEILPHEKATDQSLTPTRRQTHIQQSFKFVCLLFLVTFPVAIVVLFAVRVFLVPQGACFDTEIGRLATYCVALYSGLATQSCLLRNEYHRKIPAMIVVVLTYLSLSWFFAFFK